jgi:hypothetical protein
MTTGTDTGTIFDVFQKDAFELKYTGIWQIKRLRVESRPKSNGTTFMLTPLSKTVNCLLGSDQLKKFA